jgi:hypothetical protein
MARRKLTVDRHEEIKRRLADGRSLREIATALGCSRRLVQQIRIFELSEQCSDERLRLNIPKFARMHKSLRFFRDCKSMI